MCLSLAVNTLLKKIAPQTTDPSSWSPHKSGALTPEYEMEQAPGEVGLEKSVLGALYLIQSDINVRHN